jgi:hypothetical protein
MFKNKNKNILQYASLIQGISDLKPSKNYIPLWFKEIKPQSKNKLEFNQDGGLKMNPKYCIPFFDSLSSGYTVELSSDIYIDQPNNIIRFSSKDEPMRVKPGPPQIPTPAGYDDTTFLLWNIPYAIKTPPGYSVLYTHPFNRYDLPFLTSSAIVDSENIITGGGTPFFLKKDFNGLIEKGTPILQIIPIKRENWISKKNTEMEKEDQEARARSKSVFFGYYKKNNWFKKSYE